MNFSLLYSTQNAQNSSTAKKLFVSQLFKQIKLCFCFFSKKLKSGVTIVTELKFELPKSRFIKLRDS